MFRNVLISVARLATVPARTNSKYLLQNVTKESLLKPLIGRNFSVLQTHVPIVPPKILESMFKPAVLNTSTRTLTKYSMRKGKRKSVKAVTRRFYRLNWGAWIRTKVGRQKKLWKKSPPRKRRLRQHVFCNSTQSWMLDKMVGPYWRKPRYYVDDPYQPYHSREEFTLASIKPKPYYPSDENTS
ncbi:unnamed protein product [Psylliodes chrysocephalus]|uniref:Large ribosomal subunit protein bL35m n=1 Tax=Psylliodes chrysocephalus TaxID=3402493 RepID=A0A9P0D4D6_9CUCU|nr:unnamed protein product [Psylliodes chrysocephala]